MSVQKCSKNDLIETYNNGKSSVEEITKNQNVPSSEKHDECGQSQQEDVTKPEEKKCKVELDKLPNSKNDLIESYNNGKSSVEEITKNQNVPSSEKHDECGQSLQEDVTQPEENKCKVELDKLPKCLTAMFKPLKCELCSVVASSPVVAYAHYQGKIHKKAVNSYMTLNFPERVGNITAKSKKSDFKSYRCDVCDVTLTSDIVYTQHMGGKQHKRKVKMLNLEEINSANNSIKSPSPTKKFSTPYFCEVCSIFTDTELQMSTHKKGRPHQKRMSVRERMTSSNQVSNNEAGAGDYYNEDNVWQASPIVPTNDPAK